MLIDAYLRYHIQAFHGSGAKNWHSVSILITYIRSMSSIVLQIIRHGLWFKTVTHGRAYGHGAFIVPRSFLFSVSLDASQGSISRRTAQYRSGPTQLGPRHAGGTAL